jgi:hypothetical protein
MIENLIIPAWREIADWSQNIIPWLMSHGIKILAIAVIGYIF